MKIDENTDDYSSDDSGAPNHILVPTFILQVLPSIRLAMIKNLQRTHLSS